MPAVARSRLTLGDVHAVGVLAADLARAAALAGLLRGKRLVLAKDAPARLAVALQQPYAHTGQQLQTQTQRTRCC